MREGEIVCLPPIYAQPGLNLQLRFAPWPGINSQPLVPRMKLQPTEPCQPKFNSFFIIRYDDKTFQAQLVCFITWAIISHFFYVETHSLGPRAFSAQTYKTFPLYHLVYRLKISSLFTCECFAYKICLIWRD